MAASKRVVLNAIRKSIKSTRDPVVEYSRLVEELFSLSEDNRAFLSAKYLTGAKSLDGIKRVIEQCVYADPLDEDNSDFDFDRACLLIDSYADATNDDAGTADLMIHYVETGNRFTLDYGDIDGGFYDALLEMYERAIAVVLRLSA